MIEKNSLNLKKISSEINKISKLAGNLIIKYKENDIKVDIKNDNSPVTNADKAANLLITSALNKLTPKIPIVSEEDTSNHRKHIKSYFWLIDPLDGTKEFINGSSEFTVNIALIVDNFPLLGVVHAPALDETYFNTSGNEAYHQNKNKTPKLISTKSIQKNPEMNLILASKSHINKETSNYLKENNFKKIKNIGSSLKFCLIARGEADIYPRFGRTMEWDTAAGHAIVNSAGGMVSQMNGNKLLYGKDKYENPNFICSAN
jgi:3'(2'), 5'-bisphosphate nucleotidase